MAVLKTDTYKGFTIDVGETLEDVQEEQLIVTSAELVKAINQEAMVDRVFGRILVNRSKSHAALLAAVPGATSST